MTSFTTDGTENRMRWDRSSSSFLESWSATLHHRRSGLGLWFRYAVVAPDAGKGKPRCEMWGIVFDPDGKLSFGARNAFDGDRLAPPDGRDDGAVVRIGDAWLSECHLEGAVERDGRRLSWSLDFEPARRCFHHLPEPLRRRMQRRGSVLCSPNLSVPFTGTVTIDADVVRVEGDLGSQSHRWGRRHPMSWAWAHCSGFEEDPGGVFEGMAVRTALVSVPVPTMTLLYLRYDGQDLAFNDFKWALRARSRYELPTWAFTARNDLFKIAGAARAGRDRLVQLAYDDPDGTPLFCSNTEIADIAVEIYGRTAAGWRHAGSLTGLRRAALEFGRREPFHEVTMVP